MKYITNKLLVDLGFTKEEEKPDNIVFMPDKIFISMSKKHALKIHLTNLIETYDKKEVFETLIKILENK